MITRPPRFGFPGGLRLPGHKAVTAEAPVGQVPLPDELVVPLARHGGDPARPTVAVGDRVDRGTRIGRPAGDFSAAVHASSSGTVTAVEQRPVPHPSGLPETCVVIAPDGLDTVTPDAPAPMPDWPAASPATLRRRIADCGVVGLGGAAFPAAVKVTPGSEQEVQLLVINAIECEPWITCDDRLLRERADEVITGARILRHVLGAAEVVVALEEDKAAARDAVAAALDADGDTTIALAPVPVRYPVGGEKQLIQTLTGHEVPSGGLPLDIGVLCHNAGTAAAVTRAVVHGEPLTDRVVTVAGTGVGAPRNLRARIGTPLATLVAAAGGYHGRVNRLVIGGPMMGFAVTDDAVPVSKGCNCVLVGEQEAFP
ncbi:MAG: electron transport complex subunit RsxC, partial [Ectothiorhodospiraceae bacterium]